MSDPPIPNAAALALALLGALAAAACEAVSGASPEQPIAFSHRAHVENQIDCSFCHAYYERYDAAGMPGDDLCVSCHSAMAQDDPEMKKIFEYADAGRKIPWVRLYELPQYNHFSHRWHVRAGIECAACHGEIGTSDRAVRTIEHEMAWCIACHEEQEASVDCVICHR